MNSIIKSYLSIVLILLSFFVSLGVISSVIDVENARSYHSSVVNQIENCDHSDFVIEACKDDAQANGYELDTEKYAGADGQEIVKVTLSYEYKIKFINISKNHQIVGYAK